jgi:hypothetical protein
MVNSSALNNSDMGKSHAPKKAATSKRKASSRKSASSTRSRSNKSNGVTAKLYRTGRNAMAGAYDAASAVGSNLPKIPSNLHLKERGQSVYSMVENKPLIYGAVGLGVGVVLAALIPSMHGRNSNR